MGTSRNAKTATIGAWFLLMVSTYRIRVGLGTDTIGCSLSATAAATMDGPTGRRNIGLPILPRVSEPSDELDRLFGRYASSNGGWIDVDGLSHDKDVYDLRKLASDLLKRPTACHKAQIRADDGRETGGRLVPWNDDNLEYCMWSGDHVSTLALDNFSFERMLWKFIVDAFEDFGTKYPDIASDVDCPWGLLDLGVNVGDWLSPIRLMAPHIPIYGIEGSPANAAIAAANVRTSVEHHRKRGTTNTTVGASFILPYAVAAKGQLPTIAKNGGVCFSSARKKKLRRNIGGRSVINRMDCEAADAAGATTLLDALQTLPWMESCPTRLPRLYVAKMDVESFEFKAISTVVSVWSKDPPCFFLFEFRYFDYQSHAMVELLLDMGYDAVWYPSTPNSPISTSDRLNVPPEEPWWTPSRGGGNGTLHELLDGTASEEYRYTELIFGFVNATETCLKVR